MSNDLLALARRDISIAELCFDIRTHIRDKRVHEARMAAVLLRQKLEVVANDLEIIKAALHVAAELFTP